MSFGAIKRDKFDAAFSQLVRERAGWMCDVESCRRYFQPGRERMGLHASHFFGRARQSVRFDPRNCFSHCMGCHKKLGENPHDFQQWAFKFLGPIVYTELLARANRPLKRSKADKEELLKEMQAELRRMQALRKQGFTGRIPFTLEGITF